MDSWSAASLGSLESELCEGKQTRKGGIKLGWGRSGLGEGGRESPRSRNPTKSSPEEVLDSRAGKPTFWAAGLRWFKHHRNYKPTGFIPNSNSLPSWGSCSPFPSKGKLLHAGKILVRPAGFFIPLSPPPLQFTVRFHLICVAKMGGAGLESEYLPTSVLCLNAWHGSVTPSKRR